MSKLEATAFHEAGHAVAAFELLRAIDRVSIVDEETGTFGHVKGRTLPRWLSQVFDWDESNLSLRDRKAFEDAIVTTLSGAIAEELFTGKPNPDGARGDNAKVLDLVLRLGMEDEGFEEVGAYLTWAEVRARKHLQRNWHLVETLAAELLSRKVLSGAATRRLLRQADREWADRQL